MNRLLIIGNGFDLAHGLATSYRDFIDDFWKNFREKVNAEKYKKLIFANELYDKYYTSYGEISSFSDFKKSINVLKNILNLYLKKIHWHFIEVNMEIEK